MFAFFRIMPFKTRFYFVYFFYFISSSNLVLLLRLAEVGSPCFAEDYKALKAVSIPVFVTLLDGP